MHYSIVFHLALQLIIITEEIYGNCTAFQDETSAVLFELKSLHHLTMISVTGENRCLTHIITSDFLIVV